MMTQMLCDTKKNKTIQLHGLDFFFFFQICFLKGKGKKLKSNHVERIHAIDNYQLSSPL